MEQPRDKYEELESTLPEDLAPIAIKFLEGIDEIARKMLVMYKDPSKRDEILDELCTDGDTYYSLRHPSSGGSDARLFYVSRDMWSNLLSHPEARIKDDSTPEPYDLKILNDEQLKVLYEALIEKLLELRREADIPAYTQNLLFLLERIFNDFRIRTKPSSKYVDEIIGNVREIIEELN